jgi:hypothetical protein
MIIVAQSIGSAYGHAMDHSKRTLSNLAAELVITGGTAAAGVPFVAPALLAIVPAISQEAARRQSVALRAAESLWGGRREELGDVLASNAASVDLLIRLLYQAGNNGHERMLQMMARSLISGTEAALRQNTAALLEEETLLIALEDLTPKHLELLKLISDNPAIDNVAIAAADKESPNLVEFRALKLVSLALVKNPYGRYGGENGETEFYEISELGKLMLRAASEVAARL